MRTPESKKIKILQQSLYFHVFAGILLNLDVGSFSVSVVGLVEHDVRHHRREQQRQAAGETLDAREATARRSVEDGEPDVSVSHVLLRLRPEQVVKTCQLGFTSYRYHSVNLRDIGIIQLFKL